MYTSISMTLKVHEDFFLGFWHFPVTPPTQTKPFWQYPPAELRQQSAPASEQSAVRNTV